MTKQSLLTAETWKIEPADLGDLTKQVLLTEEKCQNRAHGLRRPWQNRACRLGRQDKPESADWGDLARQSLMTVKKLPDRACWLKGRDQTESAGTQARAWGWASGKGALPVAIKAWHTGPSNLLGNSLCNSVKSTDFSTALGVFKYCSRVPASRIFRFFF